MARNKRTRDMSNNEIRGELMKRGKTFAQLGVENGLAKNTIRNALDKPYPKGERIIADALRLEPKDIWPSRHL
ncbi:transcriptional regulator [[Haemophilus] felis]|uniref:DNA-binding protein n=1 Tax=[Haemophilus] felis TaxID=123822 RepID=A0A1T0B704_9PAST|nr:transcriptional regulator [[Haemophilus] felis]OOS05874.1 DNA-binding protein [[Haemophilus] felis]